jgi:hypothetical protein
MMQLDSALITGFNLLSIGGLGGAGGTTKASLSLQGPVLDAVNSSITLASNVIGVFDGATVTSTTQGPLIQLGGGTLIAGTAFAQAALLQINGSATPALVTLNGPILSTAGDDPIINVPGALLGTFGGGQLVVNGSTDPLVNLKGGSYHFGNDGSFGADATFSLNGLETAVEVIDSNFLELGTRQPVQAAGGLLDTNAANLVTTSIVKLDTALLNASAPLLNATNGSNISTGFHAIDLVQKARLNTSVANPLLRLDASTLTVGNGSAVAVRGASFLNIGGDIFSLNNGSTLSINNGALLLASGNSVVTAQRSLINFGGTGNVVNITNNLCAVSACQTTGGLNVLLTNGATPGNVTIITPITNPGGGTINLSNGAGTAHIIVDGVTTKVRLGVGF